MGRGTSKAGGSTPSQAQLQSDYNKLDTPWDMTPKERLWLAEKYSTQKATKDNFFQNSVGEWDLRSKKPSGEPDHVSINKRTGQVSSKYWYTKDGVYRQSDHWGSDVASCSWYIKGRKYSNDGVAKGKKETAFIKWEDLKAKGMVGKDYKTGKYFLHGFTFKK